MGHLYDDQLQGPCPSKPNRFPAFRSQDKNPQSDQKFDLFLEHFHNHFRNFPFSFLIKEHSVLVLTHPVANTRTVVETHPPAHTHRVILTPPIHVQWYGYHREVFTTNSEL